MDKLPKEWKIVNWSDITLKIGDVDHKMPKENSDGYPYVSPRDFRPNNKIDFIGAKKISKEDYIELSKKIKPEKGDIIFARYGTIGENRFVETEMDFLASYSCAIIKHDLSRVLPEFSFYYSISPQVKLEIEKYINKATQPNIGIQSISKFLFPLPPLSEQTRIVSKLDALFGRIDQSIALLEENIKHTKALIDSSIAGIFDQLGNEYQISPLLKYVDFIGGSQPPKSKFSNVYKEGYVRLIQIRDYKSNDYVVYIDKKSTTKFCTEEDVMIGRYGPPVFQILRGLNGAYNVALMKAVPNEEKLTKDYLYYFLQNSKIQNYIISISQRSAGQSGVNKKALELYEIAVPPLSVQKVVVTKINSLIDALNKLIDEQQSKLTYLKALKSSLLDRAFKGDL